MLWWLRRATFRKTHVATEQARIVYVAKPLFSRFCSTAGDRKFGCSGECHRENIIYQIVRGARGDHIADIRRAGVTGSWQGWGYGKATEGRNEAEGIQCRIFLDGI